MRHNREPGWLETLEDPDDFLNFNWETVDIGMAFEDIYGHQLWFKEDAPYKLFAMMEDSKGDLEIVHKLALIRTPEYDFLVQAMNGIN